MTEKMKPSGIAWIGDIPESWKTKKIKYYTEIVNGSTPDSSDFNCWDGPIKWITPADMDNTGIISEGERTLTQYGYNSCGTTMLPKGSVVISSRAPIGKINITGDVLCTNQGCKSLVGKADNRYLYYLLLAGQEELVRLGRGTTFIELSTYDLANFGIVLPKITEQLTIADFLDAQCAKIDSVVADIEKQIETLQKYKKSLITETVTKGLDRSVPIKDSGVEWIGEIPKHWKTIPLKYLFSLYAGGDVNEYDFSDEQTEKYRYPIYSNSLENCGLFGYTSKYRFSGNTFTVTGRGEVGKAVPRFDSYYPIVRLLACIPKSDADNEFYAYCVNSADVLGDQTAMAQLTTQKLGMLVVPLPSADEQKRISDYLNHQCKKADAVIEQKREQLRVIQQHKKSLIYEYVTGKKRVTEVN